MDAAIADAEAEANTDESGKAKGGTEGFKLLPRLPERDGFSTIAPLVFSLPQIRWSSQSMIPHTNIQVTLAPFGRVLVNSTKEYSAAPPATPANTRHYLILQQHPLHAKTNTRVVNGHSGLAPS